MLVIAFCLFPDSTCFKLKFVYLLLFGSNQDPSVMYLVLAKYWQYVGTMLALCWIYVGSPLASHWLSMLDLRWANNQNDVVPTTDVYVVPT